MNAVLNAIGPVGALLLFAAILFVIVRAANRHLNPALPKFGRGKRQKAGGDAVNDFAKKQVLRAGKASGKMFWEIVKAPFK